MYPFQASEIFFYDGMLDSPASDQSDTGILMPKPIPVRYWNASIPDRFLISVPGGNGFKRNVLLGLPLVYPLRHWLCNGERKVVNSIIMALLTVLLVIYLID
jgi:hypothetical protein